MRGKAYIPILASRPLMTQSGLPCSKDILDQNKLRMASYEFVSGPICAGPHVFVSGSTTYAPLMSRAISVWKLEAVQMGRDWKAGAQQPPRVVRKSQSQQEFEERQLIAERLVRAFREAGYSCELAVGGQPRASKLH